MAWGSPRVTRIRRQADNSLTYASGTVTGSLQHVGMIKSLLLRYNATYAYTKSVGGSTQDAQGPYNAISNVNIKVNGIGTFCDCSAWLLYLYNLVHYASKNVDPSNNWDSGGDSANSIAGVYTFPAVPGSSGNVSPIWALRFPFTIELAGLKEIGLFVLQNDEVNVQLTPSFNATAMSATPLAAPYDLAGGDSMTLGTPTLDVVREFYGVPANESDYPVVGWFHQLESQRVSMTSTTTEITHPKGGIITRILYQCVDGTGPALMADATLSRLQLLYGSNETPYDETVNDVKARMHFNYGHELPKGALVHDFFGEGNQTLSQAFDTAEYQNLRTRVITGSTPNAGSYVDVLRERLIPIGANATPLY